MPHTDEFRKDARKFVEEVLSETGVAKPSRAKISETVDRIVRALRPVTSRSVPRVGQSRGSRKRSGR